MKNNNISVKKKNKKPQSKLKKFILNLMFIVCLGVFIYSAGNLAIEYYGSYKAKNDLNKLKNSVVKSTTEKETEKVVDIDKLKELNKDSIAWIEIPGTELDEPVVQGKDNDYYLWYSFEKSKYPLTGTIFLDYQNKSDLTDRISYIFGHNMWDKSKFYCLELFEDPDFLKKHNTVKIYLKNNVLEYDILGISLVPPETPLYPENLNRDEDFPTFKKELAKYISQDKVDTLDENSKIIMLVTCKTPDNMTERRIMFAKLK